MTMIPSSLLYTQRGFTFIEILISLGILAIAAGMSLGAGIDTYERALARSDHTSIFWSVVQARAEAMHGICEEATCSNGISQRASLDSTHQVTFESGSGLVPEPESVSLGKNSATLSVNAEGQVSLTP